jgi:hypothetical protein
MAKKSISASLILAAASSVFSACAARSSAEPPAQTPSAAEPSSADAGLPNVPLTGKSVIVPSDVKLQPGPNPSAPTPASVSTPAAAPSGN